MTPSSHGNPTESESALDQYARRVECLRRTALEEGGTIRPDGEQDFWNFVQQHPFTKRMTGPGWKPPERTTRAGW